MIVDTIGNKRLHPVSIDLSVRDRKLNISMVFIKQSYFPVPKDVILNTTQFSL